MSRKKQSEKSSQEKPFVISDDMVGTHAASESVRLDPGTVNKSRCVCILPDAKEADSYRVVREQIQQRTSEKGWNTLMITSAKPGEGKTLTAINLALTFAKSVDGSALLIDGDLKQQRIHHYLGIPGEKGLADHLLDACPFEEILIRPGVERLKIISGGRTIHDSSEILGSQQMRKLVTEMKARYEDRYIFFDVPSVLGRADALALAPLVDGILMVTQAGHTSVHDIRKAVELIPKEKFLGFILNRVT